MNKVFESVVGDGFRRAQLHLRTGVDLQRSDWLDRQHVMGITPDLTWTSHHGVVTVGDVKYKRSATVVIGNHDV